MHDDVYGTVLKGNVSWLLVQCQCHCGCMVYSDALGIIDVTRCGSMWLDVTRCGSISQSSRFERMIRCLCRCDSAIEKPLFKTSFREQGRGQESSLRMHFDAAHVWECHNYYRAAFNDPPSYRVTSKNMSKSFNMFVICAQMHSHPLTPTHMNTHTDCVHAYVGWSHQELVANNGVLFVLRVFCAMHIQRSKHWTFRAGLWLCHWVLTLKRRYFVFDSKHRIEMLSELGVDPFSGVY